MAGLLLSLLNLLFLSIACQSRSFYDNPEQDQPEDSREELLRKWDYDYAFSGISTFAHLKHVKCLTEPDTLFDIGIIGAPFDTSVTYRSGARFGPRAIRVGSARQIPYRSFNPRANINPYTSWATILDCGDIPISPFDNALALHQMTTAFTNLYSRSSTISAATTPYLPRLVTLGGDHSVALPALRALARVYGQPISVLHFDAHLDTWHPESYPSAWPSLQSHFNHGSMFWLASTEGLIDNGTSVHAGLRTRLGGTDFADYDSDTKQGFLRISTDDIDDLGTAGIISTIMSRMGTETPVYLSVDIDVLDPGLAPGTGTPEPGGWTTRELIRILRGVEGLNVVGADVVEVAPGYDGRGEETATAAAQVVYEIISSMVKKGIQDKVFGEVGGESDTKKSVGGEENTEAKVIKDEL